MVFLLTLTMIFLGSCQTNKGKEGDPTDLVETGADLSKIPDVTDVPKGETTMDLGEMPEIPIVEGSMNITSADLLSLIRQGKLKAEDDYLVTDGEYLTFDRKNDKEKTYDFNGATIRVASRTNDTAIHIETTVNLKNGKIVVYGGRAISVDNDNAVVELSNLHFSGNAKGAIALGGKECTVRECTFLSEEENVLIEAILGGGKDAMITNCNFQGVFIGVRDQSETGVLVENNLFENCDCAIACESAGTKVLSNTIIGGTKGIFAKDERSQISAGMGKIYNVLVAQNEIEKTQTSILLENVSNCVVILNEVETITATGCTNVYVNENTVSGKLTLKYNNYMIANGNSRDAFDNQENSNVNGDNVTDINARLSIGANEQLLPHINKEQFVGMAQTFKFRTKYGMQDLESYIKKEVEAEKNIILLPPGNYLTYSSILLEDISDVKIYGYGVYNDFGNLKDHVWHMKNCTSLKLYGVFVGTSNYTFFQGTIVECGENKLQSNGEMANHSTVKILPDPGYKSNSTDSLEFKTEAEGVVYKAGSDVPYSAFYAGDKSYDASTKINTLKPKNNGIRGEIAVGDRITYRSGIGWKAIYIEDSSELLFEDVTVFNAYGMAQRDDRCAVAPTFHRYAVTPGAAPVLEAGDYSRYGDLIWTDSYGRLRSAAPLESTQDATHSFDARVGSKTISCLLEGMFDDGGNIGSSYGYVDSYNASTKTLTYKTCDVNGYNRLPGTFQIGDTIWLYTTQGKQIAVLTAVSETVQTVVDNDAKVCRYTVKVDQNVPLNSDQTVIIQNASAGGVGFLWDNVKVTKTNSNGLRIKTSNGTVKNCSFMGLGFSGVNMVPEFGSWPECGPVSNITVESNLFDSCSRFTEHYKTIWNEPGRYSDITVMISEVPKGQTEAGDPLFCLHQGIIIRGNIFRNSYAYNQIAISNAQNVVIEKNTFESVNGTHAPILLKSGYDITIKDNTYQAEVSVFYENRNGWAKNVTFQR